MASLSGRRSLRSLAFVIAMAAVVGLVFIVLVFRSDEASRALPSCPEGTPSGPPPRPPDAFFEETRAHPDYGGTYVLPDCFALVVLTTGDEAVFEDIARRHFVPNERFIVAQANYTYGELEQLQEQVVADRDEWLGVGIDIQSVGVDVALNRLEVGILEPNDDAREQLEARYGDRIVVVQAGPFEPLND